MPIPAKGKVKILVYGTLKEGGPLHYLLEGSRFLGKGRVWGYALYDLGAYPAARPAKEDYFIWGEVYEIEPALLELLNEVENEYYLEEVWVEIGESQVLKAWMYVYRRPLRASWCLSEGKWEKLP